MKEMNKQQNYSQKKNLDRIKALEIENALLKQKLEMILTLAKFDGYGWLKNEVIEKLDDKTVQKGILDIMEEKKIKDFAFKKEIDKGAEVEKVEEKDKSEENKDNGEK